MNCNPSLGGYGHIPHKQAIEQALYEPVSIYGFKYITQHMQLCPQNVGQINEEFISTLAKYPTQFRLHANVHIESKRRIVDLIDYPNEILWFKRIKELSELLKAPVYSAHAGKRSNGSITQAIAHTRELEQLMGIPVCLEGHYPTPNRTWLFDDWYEYQLLLESGIHYALDLSHVHVVASQSRKIEWKLVQELLNSDKCLEVHISHNDGLRDSHEPISHPIWWMRLLEKTNKKADIFYEGNLHTPLGKL